MRFMLLLLALSLGAASPGPRYANPVIDHDFPDPAVIRAHDGFYYVYAPHSAGAGGKFHNIAAARSRDLVHWNELADALPIKPTWASKAQDYWAPHVVTDRERYLLYFSAKPDAALTDDKQGLFLAVATADCPTGRFIDSGRPLQSGPGFDNIDPMAFNDPATGSHLVYWGSGLGPIKAQELAPNRLFFAFGSSPKPLLAPVKSNDTNEYRRLVEGAWVVRHDGYYYYLFASGDNCCGAAAHYCVFVARSPSAMGPFTIQPRPANLVVEGDYKPSDDVNTRRVMLLDSIEWKSGWPVLRGVHPSSGQRPAPVTQ